MSDQTERGNIMASDAPVPSPSPSSLPTPKTINVKILSPALESTSGLAIAGLAPDNTIATLKQRIGQSIPSNPRPDRQRLIYHGRLLSNDDDTLESIFGSSQLQHQSDFTLHLVLRPHSPNTPPHSASPTPLPRPSSAAPLPPPPPRPHTNPDPSSLPPPPLQQQQPQPQPHQPHIQFPPHIQAAFAQPRPGQPPAIPQLPALFMPHLQGMHQLANLHNLAQQQQQQQQQQHQHQHQHQHQPPHPQSQPQSEPQDQPQSPQSAVPPTTTHTATAPNGARYTVRVNQASFAFPPQPFNPFAHLHHPQLNPNINNPSSSPIHLPRHPPPASATINDAFDDPVTAQDVRELAELTSQFAAMMNAETAISDQTRQAAQTLRTSTDAIAARLRDMPRNNNQNNTNPPLPTTTTSPSPSSTPRPPTQPQTQPFDPTAATIYLLSSPTGPHAILFSPHATYAAQPPPQIFPINHAHPLFPTMNPFHPLSYPQQPLNQQPQETPLPPNQPIDNPPADQQFQRLVHNLQQDGLDQQPVDLLAQWQPWLAQFWLFFRVMLFAYFFFPANQGWYRPFILVAICLAFWFLSGDGPGRGIRDVVRRWWESVVVGLPARPPADQPVIPQPQINPQPPSQSQQQQQQQQAPPPPPPEQLHWLRQVFRPLERALALFLASLWPGVGERTVAARRAEEERQRREEHERLVREQAQARSAAQETQPALEPATAAPTNADSTTTATHVSNSEQLRERKPALDGQREASSVTNTQDPSTSTSTTIGHAHDTSSA